MSDSARISVLEYKLKITEDRNYTIEAENLRLQNELNFERGLRRTAQDQLSGLIIKFRFALEALAMEGYNAIVEELDPEELYRRGVLG